MIKANPTPAYAGELIDGNTQTKLTAPSVTAPTRRTLMNMMVSTALVGTAIASQTHAAQAAELDPILALIENHKRIAREYDETVQKYEDDDPALEPLLSTLSDAELNASIGLINEVPTSLQGVLALLSYAVKVEAKGCRWPEGLLDDEQLAAVESGKIRIGRPWEYFLHLNLIESLQKLAA